MAKNKNTNTNTNCDAMELLEQVKTSARVGQNPEPRVVRQETQWPVGKVARQGDIMLRRHDLMTKFETLGDASRQLAPGAEIGSKHVVREAADVRVLTRKGASALQGPIIVAPNGFYLDHPKHAHIDCSLPGCYEVLFQQDVLAQELARRRD